MQKTTLFTLFSFLLLCLSCNSKSDSLTYLKISENKRFLTTENGEPFFWLGDTGWLLFTKLTHEEAEKYFEDRRQKGFNVIQAMVLHDVTKAVNVYGDSALINCRVNQPDTTLGNSAENSEQYDYWDHIDYLINLANQKGLYMALVPVWGSNVKSGNVSEQEGQKYAAWLALRYKNCSNVIWMNGGDTKGCDFTSTWQAIGSAIRQNSPKQLITFHPFGRMQSSEWFHNEDWLDFNMFQSGHRRYDQDTDVPYHGEDNWKYVADDYAKIPVKPTLDGEPSYEGIPQGLHDTTQPLWTDSDCRRYAYWSVFAGGCGFTYGNNAIMQFHKKGDENPAYGSKEYWEPALNAPGAIQMKYLKQLILSKSYFDRIPAQDLIADEQGEKYDYLSAAKGSDYAFVYTYTGRIMNINLEKMDVSEVKASWYNPRNGSYTEIGTFEAKGIKSFDPPGDKTNGNDWVLVLEND